MNTWVFTEQSLSEFASGSYSDLDSLEASGKCRALRIDGTICVYHSRDTAESRLAIVRTDSATLPASERLGNFKFIALERLLSFFQRSAMHPIVMPRAWHSYRFANLVSFFAVPHGAESIAPRWVCEVHPQGTDDVACWDLETLGHEVVLEAYRVPEGAFGRNRRLWREGLGTALDQFHTVAGDADHGYELSDLPIQDVAEGLTFSQWITKLTGPQAKFLEAPTNESIRLRGAAGTGKTLALALKAVQEVQRARTAGNLDLRVLYLTHSWSLGEDVMGVLDSLSEWGRLDEIDVMPLLTLAETLLPSSRKVGSMRLIGEDSLSAKATQITEIEEIIDEFRLGDWLTFRDLVSADFRTRIDSSDRGDTRGLAWDCLIEFGCVLGADGIFPDFDAERRYLKLARARWMMPLEGDAEKRVVFALYELFFKRLEDRGLLSSDQLVNDFLNYLETFAWRRRRVTDGYDLVFVDEYHLFNIQERQLLKYLNRDPSVYPRLFMAMDPRQSPWEVYVGRGSNVQSGIQAHDDDDSVGTVDLPTVHRSSPEILELIKHIHLDFPNFDLGADWDLSVEHLESSADSGDRPRIVTCGTRAAEHIEISEAVLKAYGALTSGGQLAIAIVDQDRFGSYLPMIASLAKSGRVHVSVIAGREDVAQLKHRKRGVIVGPAEYLAGLQFHTVFVAGIPEMNQGLAHRSYRKRQTLSLLYLAISRARRDVRIFVNEDDGSMPEVLSKALDKGVASRVPGRVV